MDLERTVSGIQCSAERSLLGGISVGRYFRLIREWSLAVGLLPNQRNQRQNETNVQINRLLGKRCNDYLLSSCRKLCFFLVTWTADLGDLLRGAFLICSYFLSNVAADPSLLVILLGVVFGLGPDLTLPPDKRYIHSHTAIFLSGGRDRSTWSLPLEPVPSIFSVALSTEKEVEKGN